MNAAKSKTRRGRKSIAKTVKKVIRNMSETKVFYTPIAFNTAASSNGEAHDIVGVVQGSDINQRIGNVIQLRHLKIAGSISATYGAGGYDLAPVRLMVFYSATENASTITLNDYLTGSYNPKVFFPLMDKYLNFKTLYDGSRVQTQGPITFTFSKAVNYFQKYIGPSASNLTRGNLILVLNVANSASQTYTMNARVEVWYDDI